MRRRKTTRALESEVRSLRKRLRKARSAIWIANDRLRDVEARAQAIAAEVKTARTWLRGELG